jgi:hypothetical protein
MKTKRNVPDAPVCPYHIATKMIFVSEILTRTWAGRKIIFGYRYQCPVHNCPCCQTIELDSPLRIEK